MLHFHTKLLFRNGRPCKLLLEANYKINFPATWDHQALTKIQSLNWMLGSNMFLFGLLSKREEIKLQKIQSCYSLRCLNASPKSSLVCIYLQLITQEPCSFYWEGHILPTPSAQRALLKLLVNLLDHRASIFLCWYCWFIVSYGCVHLPSYAALVMHLDTQNFVIKGSLLSCIPHLTPQHV